MMTVEQMINNNGNGAMNQFIISGEGRTIFQSYASMIAELNYNTRTITIGKDYDYSTTTGKHRNIFFRDYAGMSELATLDGLRKAIKAGRYDTWTVKEA